MANEYTGRKSSGLWRLIKTAIIIAAIAFIAYQIYDKYFRKKVKQEILSEGDTAEPMLPAEND